MNDLCLVTGGAGFIGSHLVEGLVTTGRRVRVLDDLSTGLLDNFAHLSPRPEIVSGSVADPDVVNRAMEGVGLVFHLAALASVQLGQEQPTRMHQVCATGTANVLEAAKRHGVRRVVYAASASAYGIPPRDVQDEDDPLCPLSVYAAAKLAGEMYCKAFAESLGVETVRLRFFNVFGPRQRDDSPYSGVIALFAGALRQGKTPMIFGDGLQSRDFVYVTDVVQAMLRASEAKDASGRVYNIGTGRSVTLLDLMNTLNKLLGTDVKAKHGPTRTGDIRHSRADISRARRDLGYEPNVNFEDGLRRLLQSAS